MYVIAGFVTVKHLSSCWLADEQKAAAQAAAKTPRSKVCHEVHAPAVQGEGARLLMHLQRHSCYQCKVRLVIVSNSSSS